MEGIKAKAFKSQCEILVRWAHGDLEHEAEDVEWPEIVIGHALPEEFGGDGLAVVHVALGWIFTDYSVDHDNFLSVLVLIRTRQQSWRLTFQ